MTKGRIYPFDVIIYFYIILLSALILIFGRPLEMYYEPLVVNFGMLIIVSLIVKLIRDPKNRILLLIRFFYPALLFTIFYEQTGGLMKLFFSNFFDSQLVAFEARILGIEPTLWLDRHLIRTWITDILSFSYFSYYFLLPIFLLPMFFLKKYYEIRQALTAICLTFFASYILFYLYPIEGPRYHFAGQYMNEISGPIFRPMVNFMIEGGAIHGGCMPSSHVAVALVILVYSLKYIRPLGLTLLPITIGLAFGTIYGRFHYISDVAVGAAIGTVMIILTLKYYSKFDQKIDFPEAEEKRTVTFVS